MKPNLFKIATKELSQDAFITWLLQWADPSFKIYNEQLHLLGRQFVNLVIDEKYNIYESELTNIEAGRQWENIDVWAELYFSDGKKIFLILEDKVFAGLAEHQLPKYKSISEMYCTENSLSLSCAFLKTGSEPLRELNAIKELGFKIVTRKDLLSLFKSSNCDNTIVLDYKEHLQALDEAHDAYLNTPIKDWNYLAWIGLYQYIENNIKINTWHYVSNPSGGFWNLCLNWSYWDAFAIYAQIEQGDIRFKIALSNDETGLKEGEINADKVQDYVSNQLLAFAKEKEMYLISKPYPFVHRGKYRSIGIVTKQQWIGNVNENINLEKVLAILKKLNEFHLAFIEKMSEIKYDEVL